MESVRNAVARGSVMLDLDAADLDDVFDACLERAVGEGLLEASQRARVRQAFGQAEAAAPTAIGAGVAVPHVYLEELAEPCLMIVRLKHALLLDAPDGIATRFVFLMLGPTRDALRHLDTLAAIARLMSDGRFRYDAEHAKDTESFVVALEQFELRHDGHAHDPVENGLEPVEGFLAGARADVQRRLKGYADDFRDGLHPKTLSSAAFMLFACLAPAIAFGGVMGTYTEGQIAGTEMLVAAGACGLIWAFVGGQPLIIMGGTGPLLVLTALLFRLCKEHSIPFLPMYGWTGIWAGLFLILLAATNMSRTARFFSRFSTDIFSGLVSAIFIVEAIRPLLNGFDTPDEHDTALLALVVGVGTFQVARGLGRIRNSKFLTESLREFLADFSAVFAFGLMTWLALELHEVTLPRLDAPDSFATTSGRPWLVPLGALPWWARMAAMIPAAFVALLIFLNQNITARVVNKPEHGLVRGAAYHWDMLVVGVLIAGSSVFGLPWVMGAIVRSLNNVLSLATTDGGRVVHVRETRLAPILVHALIGASLLVLPVLKMVPMAVLYGLFLLMGINSLSSNQLWERMRLWVTDPEYRPVTRYTRHVPIRIIHAYTGVQVVCLAALWLIKVSAIGIAFPAFIAVLIPLRRMLGRFFTADHLAALDADSVPRPLAPKAIEPPTTGAVAGTHR